MATRWSSYFAEKTEAAPLAVFRILFGLIMCFSIIRFWANGWIEKFYIEPAFFFSYYGFEWIKPLGNLTYLLFIICGIAALMVAVGFKYRIAITLFFLSFTYIELMDKTTYLNHYYFVSVLSFLLIFLPAGACYSLDAKQGKSFRYIPRWNIDAIKLLLVMVYFYAGLAKLNSDWLLHAMPLRIWLPSKYDLPLLGSILHKEWVAYAFSWGGALYDISVPFLLICRRTRLLAFMLVVVFHTLTALLFPIGMFPYIMIASALIFFDASEHNRLLNWCGTVLDLPQKPTVKGRIWTEKSWAKKWKIALIAAFFVIQLTFPFRYLLYPGELFWTEEGFKFSWRVMLVEKVGYVHFKIVSPDTGHQFYVDNTEFLTPFQEKQMSFQPDFILEYAHHLSDHFKRRGYSEVEVYAEGYVTLNGQVGAPLH